MQTEKLYNGYFEDITCSVTFVKSEVSDQDGTRVNTITYDLLLQSEFFVITDSVQYAVEPFEDQAANIQYGNALRKMINFERLALPISAPKTPKRTEDGDSGDKVYFFERLGKHTLWGIIAAGLFGFFICLCGCNRAHRQRQLSKKSEAPMATFRISSDEDVSTIGPIEDPVDSELGARYVQRLLWKIDMATFLISIAFASVSLPRTITQRVSRTVILAEKSCRI